MLLFYVRGNSIFTEICIHRDSFEFSAGLNFNCDVHSIFTGWKYISVCLQNPFPLFPEIFFFFWKIALKKIQYTFCGSSKFYMGNKSNTTALHALFISSFDNHKLTCGTTNRPRSSKSCCMQSCCMQSCLLQAIMLHAIMLAAFRNLIIASLEDYYLF